MGGEVGHEAGGFCGPVPDDARRGDDEEARGWLIEPCLLERREELHRLSESHIVGEDAAEAVPAQEVEPAEAVALIFAQRRGNARGRIATLDPRAVECRHRFNPRGVLRLEHADLRELLPEVELEARQREAARGVVSQRLGFREHVAQAREARIRQGKDCAAEQAEVRAAVRERGEQRGARDGLTLDRHDDVQLEPVLAGRLRADLDDGILRREGELRNVVVRLDPHSLDPAEGRQRVSEKLDGLVGVEVSRREDAVGRAAAEQMPESADRRLDVGQQDALRRAVATLSRRILPLPVHAHGLRGVPDREHQVAARGRRHLE